MCLGPGYILSCNREGNLYLAGKVNIPKCEMRDSSHFWEISMDDAHQESFFSVESTTSRL